MINNLKKYAFALMLSTSLAPAQSFAATTRENNIELVTAFLRGPAAYYEFKLRNDYSRSAYLITTFIHTIRLLNDLSTSSKKSAWGSMTYDVLGFALSAGCLGTMIDLGKTTIIPENKQNTPTTCLGDDYTKLGLYVLPILEMACALIRTQQVSPRMPHPRSYQGRGATTPQALLANIGLDLTRITQHFLNNIHAHEKIKDKNILMLSILSAYLIAINSEVGDFNAIRKEVAKDIREAARTVEFTESNKTKWLNNGDAQANLEGRI